MAYDRSNVCAHQQRWKGASGRWVGIHILLKSMSVSWMRIPDWLRFQVEEFPRTQASCIFMVQLILPQLWFMFWGSTLLRCGWSILVILCMPPMALIYFGKLQCLGVVDFRYDGSIDGVSSFYCCNTSPCDQQFKALQGNGNLADVGLKDLEQDTSGKKNSAHCWCYLFSTGKRLEQRYQVTTLPQLFQWDLEYKYMLRSHWEGLVQMGQTLSYWRGGEVQRHEGEILGEPKSAAEVSLRQVEGSNVGLLAQFSWLVEKESENSIATK